MSEFSRIILRQGPKIEGEKVILKTGEPAYITDYERVVIGNGITPGGVSVGSKFLGFVTFDEFSLEVLGVKPGIQGDFVFENTTNLLYVLSGTESVLGKEVYQVKTNYIAVNKTPNPDNINIYNNRGFLSLVPDSIDASQLAGYSIGRGLERNPSNTTILQIKTPSPEITFNQSGGIQIADGGVTNAKLAPMDANTVKACLNRAGPPTNVRIQDLAEILKGFLISGTTGTIGVPVGTIIDFAGVNPPANYLPCDGKELKREEFFDLFTAIGTTWGAPTTATFNLPDLNSRTTVGAGKNKKGESTVELFDVGGYFGTSKYRLTKGQLPPHAHSIVFDIPAHSHGYSLTLQEFNGESYTTNLVANGFRNYVIIINNGPQAAPITWPPGPQDELTVARSKAGVEIKKHKQKIQQKVVEFVRHNFPAALSGTTTTASNTLSTKCFRDAGYIVDSIAADITNNANHRSIETGTLYFSGYITANRLSYPGSTVPSLPASQVIPTIEAIQAIGSYITGIDQPSEPHTITAGVLSGIEDDFSSASQAAIIDSFDNFIKVISNKDNVPKTKPNGIVYDSTFFNAASAIEENRASLQASVVNYVKTNYPDAFSAPTPEEQAALEGKCFRDTGFIVDSVVADLRNNANHRSVETGVFYFSGAVLARTNNPGSDVPTLPDNQVYPTIMAIKQLSGFMTALTFNRTPTTISKIEELIGTVTFPLENNGQNLPYQPPSSEIPSSKQRLEKIEAAQILKINRRNLQEIVSQYVVDSGYLLSNSPELAKCTRDVGYMVDAVANDLETGVNAKSIQYSVAYWDGSTSRLPENLIPNQRANTIDTINYLRSRALGFIGKRSGILGEVTSLIETMIYPLENMGQTLPYKPYQQPLSENLLAARILEERRTQIQNTTIQYVRTLNIINNRPDLQEKCFRDIGYMVDSVVSDLRNGVVSKTIQFALAYFDGSLNRIKGLDEPGLGNNNPNQVSATIKTIQYLSDLCLQILLQNIPSLTSKTVNGETLSAGEINFNGMTNDGTRSALGLNNDPVYNSQLTAVVNKIIKVR